jgi:excisionase family DNA binding protein
VEGRVEITGIDQERMQMNANTQTLQEPAAMLKLDQVAGMLNVSTRTVRRLTVRGQLHALAVSARCLRFRRSDVQQYIENLGNGAGEAHA